MSELTKKHEKIAFGAVILGGIAALALGFAYIGNKIESPLRLKPRSFQTLEEQELAKQAELRTKDTDQDGIVDYDEIYVYRTSAYLPDTDSDGFDDKKEIESGNDPNCPSGRDCGVSNIATEGASGGRMGIELPPGTLSAGDDLSSLLQGLSTGGDVENEDELNEVIQALNSATPEEIRAMLLENGAPEEALSNLSDEELMSLYQESLSSAAEQAQSGTEEQRNNGE